MSDKTNNFSFNFVLEAKYNKDRQKHDRNANGYGSDGYGHYIPGIIGFTASQYFL